MWCVMSRMFGVTWDYLFPEILTVQDLGKELERRRLEHGLSRAAAGRLVDMSGTWVLNLEKWKDGHRCWTAPLFQYMLIFDFSRDEILLCLQKFGLYPDTEGQFWHFLDTLKGYLDVSGYKKGIRDVIVDKSVTHCKYSYRARKE